MLESGLLLPAELSIDWIDGTARHRMSHRTSLDRLVTDADQSHRTQAPDRRCGHSAFQQRAGRDSIWNPHQHAERFALTRTETRHVVVAVGHTTRVKSETFRNIQPGRSEGRYPRRLERIDPSGQRGAR